MWWKFKKGEPKGKLRVERVQVAWYDMENNGDCFDESFIVNDDNEKELLNRLLRSTELDLRHYLIKYIQDRGVIDPQPLGHWKFVPEEWAAPACARDRELLFGFRHKEEEK